jgi:putative glycerol-1-phosphate prenyltransferase
MNALYTKIKQQAKQIAILIDPDKKSINDIAKIVKIATQEKIDFIFVGGSLTNVNIDEVVLNIKKLTEIPVILFPGNLLQISHKADGILLLSLISGRNAEFLIGNHVIAAPFLKNSKLEIISTGYMIIEGDSTTSVQYMSNTNPIPKNKPEIAVATAMAGEMLGLKTIYLEAGSGANSHISLEMIREVKSNINIPLIVGGGIRTAKAAKEVCDAGADVIVIGTAFEKNPELISEIRKATS